MEQLHFSILINSNREKVWQVMLDDKTYREWTAEFTPGSYYSGNWSGGSKIIFAGPNPNNLQEVGGMVARIKESKQGESIKMEYVGLYANGAEDMQSTEAKKWIGGIEEYAFVNKGSGTELQVTLKIPNEYKEMFTESWPNALKKLKEICERV
jgi:L-rhamnose mutarotase